MKKCPYCGAEMDGALFLCSECGKQSEQPTVKPNYDQYYDDILPEDEGVETKRKGNSAVAVRVGLVVFALVLVISAGIAVLFLI